MDARPALHAIVCEVELALKKRGIIDQQTGDCASWLYHWEMDDLDECESTWNWIIPLLEPCTKLY